MPQGGYHCPYCDGRSEDGWWTGPQLRVIEASASAAMDDEMHDLMKQFERSSSESLTVSVSRTPPAPIPRVPDEPNDMRRVDFDCHGPEPVKVLDDWNGDVHCIVCGLVSAEPRRRSA